MSDRNLLGIAEAIATVAAGVALPRDEAAKVNAALEALRGARPVKISAEDVKKALEPMVKNALKSLDDRVKALENAAKK